MYTLTASDLAALQAFADAHGRRWKDELSQVYWYNARVWTGPVPGMGTTLHGLRNNLGPTWLYDACDVKPTPPFTQWLNALTALIGLAAVTALLADSDTCAALRLWQRKGWSVADAAAAIRDQGL